MDEEKNAQPYTSLYRDARCNQGHELEFVSEGFALCRNTFDHWWAWSMSPARGFIMSSIIGRDGNPITAYVQEEFGSITRQESIDIIDKAMQAVSEQPYDEERERQRLIPV